MEEYYSHQLCSTVTLIRVTFKTQKLCCSTLFTVGVGAIRVLCYISFLTFLCKQMELKICNFLCIIKNEM